MRQGIERLRRRIADVEAFDILTVQKRWDASVTALEKSLDETLGRVFGHGTVEYNRYYQASKLDHGGLVMGGGPDPISKVHKWLAEGKESSLALLRQAVKGLEEEIGYSSINEAAPRKATALTPATNSRRVFIVHGHKGETTQAVARFLTSLDLVPVILHEQPNKGRTIITKFREEAADIAFAVVLMTPDDQGSKVGEPPRLRARQNVVFELGFFIGALGPEKVAALVESDVERPSDFDGVVYISLDSGHWKFELAKELRAAGISVDLNKL
jgi:predicted nucleotide-binding protein